MQGSIVCLSTMAKYRVIASTAAELQWVRSLLNELGVDTVASAASIYCDNIGATYLYVNPVFHSCMKHIALDYHFVRELVQSGKVRVSLSDQLADALMKPLPSARIRLLCSKIGVSTSPPS